MNKRSKLVTPPDKSGIINDDIHTRMLTTLLANAVVDHKQRPSTLTRVWLQMVKKMADKYGVKE